MRLQRALARAGIASRREAEKLILNGHVLVNGEVATIGTSVDLERDVVTIGRRRVRISAISWIALHKPLGYVVSKKDNQGRPTVFELVPDIPGLTYVGRLDILTSGLLLMTTDGQAVHRLTHPSQVVERAYRVEVRGMDRRDIREALSRPIRIGGRNVQMVSHKVSAGRRRDIVELDVVLTEGRNRIVRRMCEYLGLEVQQLVRLSHGPIRLGDLKSGKWRYLSKSELNVLNPITVA